ncbi:hypothetical protein H8R23_04905 [Flavobacterium sp. F-380]|uniref:BACON domain-containing protein n=1 Tax=Flavobacterium kayseriense TaxID=2764714 RepID=A0ABR7J5D5_9FLAO|nr:hypothetical protein [Flavobacterium kayseriense]MBC5840736.1 hypothetical protein [Flavobacterium kayseriense]MBC5846594.1 hypothetical protein [Flavobacterium kayseriense]
MANSYVTVEFIAVPDINNYIGIDESVSGFGLNEIFKTDRTTAGETKIPAQADDNKYSMTISATAAGVSDHGAIHTPIGGTLTSTPLTSLLVEDNLDGTYTYELCSETSVVIYEISSGMSVVWSEGSFDQIGSCGGYAETISANYKTALDLDFNGAGQFTITNVDGVANSGLGTVTITANFPNAVFSLPETFPFAIITITNISDIPDNTVSPLLLEFQVFPDVANAPAKEFSIQTEEAWSIANVLPAWLELSATSGTADATITATPVNYEALAAGNYTTALNVVVGAETFVVTVNLAVFSFVKNPFSPGKLYFTQELEYLNFDTATAGTFVALNIQIKVFAINTYEPIIYTRPYNFPLFKGKGDFHVGSIVHELFEEIQELTDFVPNLKTNYTKPQYRPAEITVSFEEKTFNATVPGLVSGELPMFKMAKGNKPFTTESQLILLTTAQQEVTRITPQSFVGTSFVYFGKPRIIVKQNNKVIDDFEITEADPNKVIFSYFRFVNNLKAGDSLDLIIINGFETRSQRFLVFQNGMESTYFFFENDNQMLEPYEFSGRRRMNPNFKHVTTRKFKDLYAFDSKVKTEVSQSFIINTGQLAKADYLMVMAIVASTKVWCSFDNPEGPYFKVDATTTKLTTQDTSSSEEDFNIEFNILENAHASIYPR